MIVQNWQYYEKKSKNLNFGLTCGLFVAVCFYRGFNEFWMSILWSENAPMLPCNFHIFSTLFHHLIRFCQKDTLHSFFLYNTTLSTFRLRLRQRHGKDMLLETISPYIPRYIKITTMTSFSSQTVSRFARQMGQVFWEKNYRI